MSYIKSKLKKIRALNAYDKILLITSTERLQPCNKNLFKINKKSQQVI